MYLSSDLLPLEHILLDLEVNNKKRLFEEMAEIFAKQSGLNEDKIFQVLLLREKLGSTALDCGAAIPHGRVSGLEKASVIFARLKKAISFDSYDDHQVDLIFAVIVPEAGNEEHMKIFSHIARKISNEEVREQLRTLSSAAAISDLFFAS